jgi:DNA-directed RNA polymerase specialized sigma24 family protein
MPGHRALVSPGSSDRNPTESEGNLTVVGWLGLLGEDRERAGTIIRTLAARAAARIPHRWWDRDDAAHEAVYRAMIDNCAALRRVETPATSLIAWLRGCVRNLCRERERERERERGQEGEREEEFDGAQPQDVRDSGLDPVALSSIHEGADAALALLDSLPPPFGHVLYLRLGLDATYLEIWSLLVRFGPISLSHTARLVLQAQEMLDSVRTGGTISLIWPRQCDPEKNPWFKRNLPRLASLRP